MTENTPNILIVDDERDLCEILSFNLSSEGYHTSVANSAEEALAKELEMYDLILLDVMMGELSGYKMADIIRRERNLNIPIIFMTAKTTENDILTGFNVGADDYITKPFSIKEVIARVKAVLKRGVASNTAKSTIIKIDQIVLDTDKKILSIEDEEIELNRKEFEIFALLLQHTGQYIPRDVMLSRIWSDDVVITERTVDVNISRLRKKIGAYGRHIKGKTGYGYSYKI